MKKLLLLDADVVIDLHTLGLFNRISKGYVAPLAIRRKPSIPGDPDQGLRTGVGGGDSEI
jgi:hypothetical protein